MPTYAAKTTVAPEQSRAEIERTLARYGATGFAYGWQNTRAMLGFEAFGRRVRFELPLPDPTDEAFTHYKQGASLRERTESAARDHYDQAVRQRWRALALAIKAKLEVVDSGIAEFEEEFLAYVVLPDGSTMGEHARPAIATAYETGKLPPLLELEAGK